MIPHEILTKKDGDDCRLLLTIGQRLLLLLCLLLLCWIVSSVLNGMIISKFGQTTRVLRIAAVIQSLLQIILPSLVAALMVSRRPARFLEIDRGPDASAVVLSVALLVASMPFFNCIIQWNMSLHLPEFLASVEQWMHEAENSAATTIRLMQGRGSIGDLILNILIIGVMAGLGEELLFRGTIQRMLVTGGMNIHVAIWLVAIMFSAIHLQFFGFVPRMLLGALFGYLLYWSGSLWLPIIVHASNNIIYVIFQWIAVRNNLPESSLDNIGTLPGQYIYAIASAILTILLLWRIRHVCRN